MTVALYPFDELQRLGALQYLNILDTEPEQEFDDVTKLLAKSLDVPIALISLVDSERQWFKSKIGLDTHETAREISFCTHAVANNDTLVIEDTLHDSRFENNPLVLGDPNIRFYAGVPLRTDQGYPLGTLCAIDRTPRELSPEQVQLLQQLAELVERRILLRKRMLDLEKCTGSTSALVQLAINDLRQPVAVISISAQVLAEHAAKSPAILEQVNNLLSASANLHNMLLSLAAVGIHPDFTETLSKRPVELRAIFDGVRKGTRRLRDSRSRVIIVPTKDELTLTIDTAHFARSLESLSHFALNHASSARPVVIQCEVEASWVSISIDCPLCTLSEDEVKLLLNPLYRRTQNPTHLGHGLSLLYARRVIEAHDGSLCFKREPGKGRVFRVRMPLR